MIEVAESSLRDDRAIKVPLYARAGPPRSGWSICRVRRSRAMLTRAMAVIASPVACIGANS